jgi:hypothetical protein
MLFLSSRTNPFSETIMTLEEIRHRVLSEFADVHPGLSEDIVEVERHLHIYIRHTRKYKDELLIYYTMLTDTAETAEKRQINAAVSTKLRDHITSLHQAEAELSGR